MPPEPSAVQLESTAWIGPTGLPFLATWLRDEPTPGEGWAPGVPILVVAQRAAGFGDVSAVLDLDEHGVPHVEGWRMEVGRASRSVLVTAGTEVYFAAMGLEIPALWFDLVGSLGICRLIALGSPLDYSDSDSLLDGLVAAVAARSIVAADVEGFLR